MYDIKYWDNLKKTQEILGAYQEQRKKIIDLIRTRPASLAQLERYLVCDRNCTFRMAFDPIKRNGLTTSALNYQCGNCLLLERLGFQQGRIETGTCSLIVKTVECPSLISKLTSNRLINDPFTQRVLVSYLLNDIKDGPRTLPLHIGFVCGSNGVLIYDQPLKRIQEKPTLTILGELVEIVNRLERMGFQCGTQGSEDLFFIDRSNRLVFRVPGICRIKIGSLWFQTLGWIPSVSDQKPREILRGLLPIFEDSPLKRSLTNLNELKKNEIST